MKNFIKNLEIENFKSIKKAKLECEKINLFIGEPNVGKSNILEAISLYGALYSQDKQKFLSEFIRYNEFKDLFFDYDVKPLITVKSVLGNANINYKFNVDAYEFVYSIDDKLIKQIINTKSLAESKNLFDSFLKDNGGFKNVIMKPVYKHIGRNGFSEIDVNTELSPVKKYEFKSSTEFKNRFQQFLLPPYGENLATILQSIPSFTDEVASLFEEYGLELVTFYNKQEFLFQKKMGRAVIQHEYNLMADTLQRYIFHLAAIESNKDSVILFEEPESHSFPSYILSLVNRIVNDESNQYFITSHNTYLFNEIIERKIKETAVFYTYYENYETKFKKLTFDELQEILDHGADIFLNLNWFENE